MCQCCVQWSNEIPGRAVVPYLVVAVVGYGESECATVGARDKRD